MHARSGARTPEELEILLEDALMVRNLVALATLFDVDSALAAKGEHPSRGGVEAARRALVLWDAEHSYLAITHPVLATRDVALVLGEHGVNVMRRDRDGGWHYAIIWHVGDE